jgi:hypothetical protein
MTKIKGKQIELNTNPNLGTSDKIIASQYAIKQYVDNMISQNQAIIYTFTISSSTSSPATISHSLNTFDLMTVVYDQVTKEDVIVNVDRLNANQIQISYGTITNDLRVLIFAADTAIAGTSGLDFSSEDKNTVDVEIFTSSIFNATPDTHYLHYNGSTACVVNLPSNPKLNQQIIVSDFIGQAATNNITISGNGKLINGNVSALIDTPFGSTMFIYNGINWMGMAFVS